MTLLEWYSVQTVADRWILIGFRMEQKKVKRFATIFAEQAKKMEVEQQIREYLNMTSNLEAHLDDFGFDAQLVKSLVQRIEVSADKRIRIVFGFQDVLADFGKESAGK